MSEPARCLVLGGSGALGRVVCTALAAADARIVFTYHQNEGAASETVAQHPSCVPLAVDFESVNGIEHTVDEAVRILGGLDALVQCGGVAITVKSEDPRKHHNMEDVDIEAWDRMMDVNVRSTFFAVRRALPALAADGGGNIVLVGSIDGVKPAPSPVHYAASKGALSGMTLAMSKELGKKNIRVNVVAPGIMDGGISDAISPELRAEYLKHCGLKRVGKFSEIASVVVWLALENTYVTGQTIIVDGAL
jgi:NAD(P)-dependent dehydrogenase (short-subunit alcohol dehydrogenase family)